METPSDRKYSKEHTWARPEPDGTALVGITFFAQDQLGEVFNLVLPSVGGQVRQDQSLGEAESSKTVSAIISPVSGEVMKVNPDLSSKPFRVNDDPYEKGWLVRVRLADAMDLDRLLDAAQYDAHVDSL